jgi:O-antigen/teichoic acid export membrane protein
VFTYYVMVVGFVALAISVLAREIVVVMTTPAFYDAVQVVPYICLAYLFYGMGLMVNSGLAVKDKMKYSGMLVSLAAVINFGLNFALIPRYGMMGAAYAALAAFALLFVAQITINLHFWRIPYEYGKITVVAAIGLILYTLSQMVPATSFWTALGLKLLLLAVFPLLLRALGLLRLTELRKAN